MLDSHADPARARALQVSPIEPARIAASLHASRDFTVRCHESLEGERWLGPYLPNVNPPLWELGHVAWFLERWCLRHPRWPDSPSLIAHADARYDSSRIAHSARWFASLPTPRETLAYLADVTDKVLERLDRGGERGQWQYFVELSLYHQDMHNEAFAYTRQTLGRPNPYGECCGTKASGECGGDVHFPGGTFLIGATGGEGFIFDNEKWGHEIEIKPFSLARAAVCNAQFSEFVDSGGYERSELWSAAGWRWRTEQGRRMPAYWRKRDGRWEQRAFDQWRALATDEPVTHVNFHEAQAWCRWAGRRLPSEAEWEYAASLAQDGKARRRYPWGNESSDASLANLDNGASLPVGALPAGDSVCGVRQMLGNVWEWTSSVFQPYPGFSADPYEDYSRPWFGTHRVLRGGSFATTARIARNAFRNFYTDERCDIFAGFRTCAP